MKARRAGPLEADSLKQLGVVMKRAQYFITVGGKMPSRIQLNRAQLIAALSSEKGMLPRENATQLSFFDTTREDIAKCLTGQI